MLTLIPASRRGMATAMAAVKKNLHPYAPPLYSPIEALEKMRIQKKRNFIESAEFCVNLRLDYRKAAEQIRVVADLPAGTGGKTATVCAFTNNEEQALAAKAAGCELVGGTELVQQIASDPSLVTFDKCVCTADVLPDLTKLLGRVLGPKGLMPTRKLNTVTMDLAHAVGKAKAGQVQLRLDRGGSIHCGIGKMSMDDDALLTNLKAVLLTLENNKPVAVKGKRWVKTAFLKTSMGIAYALKTDSIDPKHQRFMV